MYRVVWVVHLGSFVACRGPEVAGDGAHAFDLHACAGAGMAAFRCGALQVPENHEVPDGRLIASNALVLAGRPRGTSRCSTIRRAVHVCAYTSRPV